MGKRSCGLCPPDITCKHWRPARPPWDLPFPSSFPIVCAKNPSWLSTPTQSTTAGVAVCWLAWLWAWDPSEEFRIGRVMLEDRKEPC